MRNGKPTVLVVDDDASVRKSLQRLLRSAGFSAQVFATGVELLSHDPFDGPCCLVLDVQMPEMSGLEVQRHLAASGSHIPIVFITAHTDTQVRDRAMQAGAAAFLEKPFHDQTLLDAVEAALGGTAPGV